MTPFVRSEFNYDRKEASDEVAVGPGGPSLTVQSQSEDADINVLMKRFGVTGKFPENPRIPEYGDFSQVRDFRSAWDACAKAADDFMQYPADFRARFDNDPQMFLQFVSDPVNIPEMRKLGLFKPEVSNGSSVGGGSQGSGGSPGASSGAGAQGGNAGAGVVNAAGQSGGSSG